MADAKLSNPHDHVFLGAHHARNERRTWLVIALTAVTMVAEIVAGTLFGSMALVADGWHMSTHATALLITALAYLFARRHARDPRFTFGTGKIGDLAGFASAIVLAVVALLIGWESLLRLYSPIAIDVPQAIAVAVIGLAVNLASAWLLRDDHDHDHDHDHHHHHHAGGQGDQDNNLRAAYLHVLADALTSVLAIAALLLAGLYGWFWLDPVIGLVGAMVIVRWTWGLLRDAGTVLLDCGPAQQHLSAEIRRLLETGGDEITDLRVWRLGPGHHAAIVALASPRPQPPSFYRRQLAQIHDLSHVTIEVEGRAA